MVELFVWNETGELEQTGPHESSRLDRVEQRVLGEHGPALALSTLEHFVEHSRGHRDNDQTRDQAREKRVPRPEPVVSEVPHDRTGQEEHTEATDDPC